jgi:hypothetical protein
MVANEGDTRVNTATAGEASTIRYLGHAGFIVTHAGVRLLIDPWFYPAFLGAWFPFPDNRDLLAEVTGGRFDVLYVSHAHEDHFDARVLEQLDREITVLVPRYRSKWMVRRLTAMGFHNLVVLRHREQYTLADGFTATMLLDTSHKEDSGLQLDMDGFRFLDLNDCNTRCPNCLATWTCSAPSTQGRCGTPTAIPTRPRRWPGRSLRCGPASWTR